MMIPVKYSDGTYSKVHPHRLQDLISSKQIKSFMRSDGWVDVEHDPIRRRRNPALHQGR